ncbi:MAG TPA: hypothetical protein PK718_05425 [Candidatus Methanofastidiosa archaeon]|nr:hypothetical protein [Candidatus Methanofastidiosa archaeon]
MPEEKKSIKPFSERFYDFSINKEDDFKKGVLHYVDIHFGDYILDNPDIKKSFLKEIGKFELLSGSSKTHGDTTALASILIMSRQFPSTEMFKDGTIYGVLRDTEKLEELLYFIEKLSLFMPKDDILKLKESLDSLISKYSIAINTHYDETTNSLIFYPTGEKIFDEKLIEDTLQFLNKFPEIKKRYILLLDNYENGKDNRTIADDLRFCLEQFLRKIFSNRKPLEKQKDVLVKYIGTHSVNPETYNIVMKIYDIYSNYLNDVAKHGDKITEKYEIEFIIYWTGIFIRLLCLIDSS